MTSQHPEVVETRADPIGRSQMRDGTLVARVRGGDSLAYSELWSRHAVFAANSASTFASPTEIDDLVAEAFARIYSRILEGGGPSGDFRPYLYVSIRNLAAEWSRARREYTTDDEDWFEVIPAEPDVVEGTQEDEFVLTAFQALPARWQQALWYSEIEGLALPETAARLDLTPNAASQLLFRAREGLRTEWVQAHQPARPVAEGCRWTTERMGAYERGRLGRRDRGRFDAHCDECDACAALVVSAQRTGSRLRALLFPLFLAGGGLALWQGPDPAAAMPVRALSTRASNALRVPRWALAFVATAAVVCLVAGPMPPRPAEREMRVDRAAPTATGAGPTLDRPAVEGRAATRAAPVDREEPASAPPPAPAAPREGFAGGPVDDPVGGVRAGGSIHVAGTPGTTTRPDAADPLPVDAAPIVTVSIENLPGEKQSTATAITSVARLTVINSSAVDAVEPIRIRVVSLSSLSPTIDIVGADVTLVDATDPANVVVELPPLGAAREATLVVRRTQNTLMRAEGCPGRFDDNQPFRVEVLAGGETRSSSEYVARGGCDV